MVQIDENLIIKFYTYFYKKRYNSISYKFKPSEKATKTISTFIKLLDKHYSLTMIGEEFLWRYFIYQMNYWRNAELVAFHGQFRIEYIIGTKAFKRFIDSAKDDHWVIDRSDVIVLYGFRKSDLIKLKTDNTYKGDFEEKNKLKFHNTNKGLYHCIITTTLYNPEHNSCKICIFKEDCKKILKTEYPNIYGKRKNKADFN